MRLNKCDLPSLQRMRVKGNVFGAKNFTDELQEAAAAIILVCSRDALKQ